MSLFSPYQSPRAITTDATAAVADDIITATLTASSTLTLYAANGNFAAFASPQLHQGGKLLVVNSASSTAALLVAANSADVIVGTASVSPGQIAIFECDGVGVWYGHSVGSAQTNALSTIQVPLTAANIIAMGTTPVSLIAAPGAGKITLVHNILVKVVRTSTAFTGGGAVEFRYTNASGAKVTADVSASLITGSVGTAYSAVAGVTTELTPVANAAIVIDNATAAFAAGTGTANVTIKYSTITA